MNLHLVGVKQFVAVLAPNLGRHDVPPVVGLKGGVGSDGEVVLVEVGLVKGPLGAGVLQHAHAALGRVLLDLLHPLRDGHGGAEDERAPDPPHRGAV